MLLGVRLMLTPLWNSLLVSEMIQSSKSDTLEETSQNQQMAKLQQREPELRIKINTDLSN